MSTRRAANEQRTARRKTPTDPLAELGLAFRRVYRALSRMRGRDTHLGGTELSHAQYELLVELHERGELSAGQLAEAARLAPGTVTQMLEALAESGYVERDRSQADRRVVVSRLTPKARRQIAAKHAAWAERWERALAGLSPGELEAATTVLERLGEMFEQASAQTSLHGGSEGRATGPSGGRKPA
jgi:DNA-binding MarR family transcriptional regulator